MTTRVLEPPGWLLHCIAAALLVGLISTSAVLPAQAFEAIRHNTNLKAVYVHEIAESDKVIVQLLIGAGEVDAAGPLGLAHYLEHLVMTDYQIKSGRKPTPHRTNAFTTSTMTNYVVGGLPHALPQFVRQMSRVLEKPSLSSREVIRERNVVSREFDLRVLQNPRRKAYERIGQILYRDHPLNRSVLGTQRSIPTLQLSLDR